MTMELYFVSGLLVFVLVVASLATEHFIASHWFGKESVIVRALRAFEKKHPNLCDNKDDFYCFFKKGSLGK